MKYRSIALLLFAAPLAAQTTTPLTFPTLTDPIAQAGSANTNLTVALFTWQGTVEKDLNNHEIRLLTLESQIKQIEVQNQTIAALQDQINKLKPVVPPPAPVTIFAPTATSGVSAVDIQPTPDSGSNGSKVILAAGRSYVYMQAIAPGTYSVTARLSSDTGTTGNISLHLESPAGTRVSGTISTPCNSLWVNVPAGAPLVLTASPLVVVADAVCSGRSYLDILSLNP